MKVVEKNQYAVGDSVLITPRYPPYEFFLKEFAGAVLTIKEVVENNKYVMCECTHKRLKGYLWDDEQIIGKVYRDEATSGEKGRIRMIEAENVELMKRCDDLEKGIK